MYRCLLPPPSRGSNNTLPDGTVVEAPPHLSVLYHNDCMFIAHHLQTMGHQFSSRFVHALLNSVSTSWRRTPTGLQGHFTFVDVVPLFRDLARDEFSFVVVSAVESVARALPPAPEMACHVTVGFVLCSVVSPRIWRRAWLRPTGLVTPIFLRDTTCAVRLLNGVFIS